MPIINVFDFFIQWHLTEKCNLKCKHCYQTDKKTDEMSFEEIKKTSDEISETVNEWKKAYNINYSLSFNITGGEPFLRKDLFAILSEIKYSGADVYLLTNGILIDERKAKVLAGIGVDGVQVSMEGPEKIHDSIRGKGSFSSSVRGVRHLLDAGLGVTLNVTLSSVNAEYFEDMTEIALTLGVQRLGFSRLVPSGRGEAMLKEMLDKERVRELYEKIFSLDTGKLEILTGDPVASRIREKITKESTSEKNPLNEDFGNIATGGCAAGISGLTILPDGTLLPCRRLNIPVGNIRKDSLREIWATSGVLESLRDRRRYKGKCGICKMWAICRGCRAIAYAYAKTEGEDDFLVEDPQCFIV
ncbi:MAG: radical SAM protein [Nitrospirae bacterium]|jgi:AdoMet-dependent heme synthase|nr:radical SAM protein [Nitrospirota bacterium]